MFPELSWGTVWNVAGSVTSAVLHNESPAPAPSIAIMGMPLYSIYTLWFNMAMENPKSTGYVARGKHPMEDLALPSLVVELKDAFLLCTFKLLSCGAATERLVAPSRVDVNFSTKLTMMKGSSYCYRQFMILRQQCDGFHGNQSRIRLCHHTVCMFKVLLLKGEPLPSTTPLLLCFQINSVSRI